MKKGRPWEKHFDLKICCVYNLGASSNRQDTLLSPALDCLSWGSLRPDQSLSGSSMEVQLLRPPTLKWHNNDRL